MNLFLILASVVALTLIVSRKIVQIRHRCKREQAAWVRHLEEEYGMEEVLKQDDELSN